MSKDYITRTEAARLLGVSPRTITNYVRGGKLEGAFKLGVAWAIPRQAVEELVGTRPQGGFKRGRKRESK